MTRRFSLVLAMCLCLLANRASAVILYGTSNPSANTTAPTGGLADSGWQYEGFWHSFLGTPVAPNYFLTAKHVGGTIGDTFYLNGTYYDTVAKFDNPNTDLTLWQTSQALPVFAPIYTSSVEITKPLVVFGRGTQRGAEVRVSGELKGWQWGSEDHVQRWGTNVVSGVYDGGANLGALLTAAFNAGDANEAHLSVGDSGGGVFVQEGALWKLAGINYGVDGPFNTTDSGSGFSAAIFDAGGLYYKNSQGWQLIPDQANDIPSSFYATRVSANAAWIEGITGVPEPSTGVLAAIALGALLATAARKNRVKSLD